MVVKYHQNRHKIYRRCTFESNNHNYNNLTTDLYFHPYRSGRDYCSEFDYLLYNGSIIDIATMKVKFYIQSLCCFRTFFLKSSVKYADRNNDSSESIFSLLDTVCSDGIYFEVTFSPGNILIST